MGRELLTVIEQIGREKGIDAGRILDAVEAALVTAAKKRYGAVENIQVKVDRKSGEIEAISVSKPTLEDVFIHRTGHKFWTEDVARDK